MRQCIHNKLQFGFILYAGVRDDKKVNGSEHPRNGAGSQVTENNFSRKSTPENANFSNETHVGMKNSLGLDGPGVPMHSLADDTDYTKNGPKENSENFRTTRTVNSNNNNGCKIKEEVNGLADDSEDLPRDANTNLQKRITHETKENNNGTTENIAQKTTRATKTSDKECSSAKVLDFDGQRNQENVLKESTNVLQSYDAKKDACKPGSVGLVNPVNMCYINSIVQCLSSIVELRKYLLCK